MTALEDLILAKLQWASTTKSEMRIRDIANLTRTEYDAQYVDTWIHRLDLMDIWSDVEKWKTQAQ